MKLLFTLLITVFAVMLLSIPLVPALTGLALLTLPAYYLLRK